jgi:16S rRNA (guanine527-N7)-methyltransferase
VFAEELNRILPADLPHRETVVEKAGRHLALIEEANQYLNLTRITSARDAAIKHVLDSVLPWHLFAGAKHVLDAGTGAGFPGIPLSLVLPAVQFTLAESVQKKARFVESALEVLQLPNASIAALRAEDLVKSADPDIITLRAVAPLPKALDLFAAALKKGVRLLLYKGPDAPQEIEEASGVARKLRAKMQVVMTYDLPDGMGTRTIIEVDTRVHPR